MSTFLTSWKEIASYLGKSVRTVQRWEQEFQIPIRRPSAAEKLVVFAVRDEIDAWVQSLTTERLSRPTEIRRLQARIELLETENIQLREQLPLLTISPEGKRDDVRIAPVHGAR
jgi:predicted DNA-binding transcriptional regulator AlpA